MTTLDARLAQAGAEMLRRFTERMRRERELLLEDGDLSPREVDCEISEAMSRFRKWLPGELQRLRQSLN